MEKELIEKVAGLCYEITRTTKIDAFFRYEGHVNNFDVEYFENDWEEEKKGIYIVFNKKVTTENLEKAINKLEKLKEEVSK